MYLRYIYGAGQLAGRFVSSGWYELVVYQLGSGVASHFNEDFLFGLGKIIESFN